MKRWLAIVLILAFPCSVRGGTGRASRAAVSTPHPLATAVAIDVLLEGGNAIDAGVAAAFALAVADPGSASLGGGGLLLWFEASSGTMWALDFRELAPRVLSKEDRPGARMAVPGFVPGMSAAQERFGSLRWKDVIAPSVALAREGPVLTSSVAASLGMESERFRESGLSIQGGSPPTTGARLETSRLAATLEAIAADSSGPFTGAQGRRLVAFLREQGSTITLLDLESYEPVWRSPLLIERDTAAIHTFPPPSGGGFTMMHMARHDPPDASATVAQLTAWFEVLRDGSRQRLLRMGDPDRTRLDLSAPVRESDLPQQSDAETSGGSGLAVIDTQGNALALVLTTGSPLGSGVITPDGFIMNDSLLDFDDLAGRGPNTPEPLRRPGTSMTPVIVAREGSVVVAAAAGGGAAASSAIASFTLSILAGESPEVAIEQPRYHHEAIPDQVALEQATTPQSLIDTLTETGQAIRLVGHSGEIHAVVRHADKLVAVADPRAGGSTGGY